MEREIETATNERREKAAFIQKKRVCGNPECRTVWDDEHVTICLKCGWGTRWQQDQIPNTT